MTDRTYRVAVGVRTLEIRQGIFLAVVGEPSIRLVGTSTTVAELATQVRALKPDVVVLEEGLSGHALPELIGLLGVSPERVLVVPQPDTTQPVEADVTANRGDLISLIVQRAR